MSGRSRSVSRLPAPHRLAFLGLLLLPGMALFEAQEVIAHDEPVLHGQFSIGREGRQILLPVQIGGEEHQFILDTGAARSGIDVSLIRHLGAPTGSQRVKTAAGDTIVSKYDWPLMKLGDQELISDGPILGVDLSAMRQACGEQIRGIIGMDVLRKSRLRIDFDTGVLRFLESPKNRDEDWGHRIPLILSREGLPCVIGVLPNNHWEALVLDTGAGGNSLRPELFDKLVQSGHLKLGGPVTSMTVAGEIHERRGYLSSLSVEDFPIEGLRFARMSPNSLGLRYLSRFQVVLDFPAGALYLQKGAEYLRPEPHATSGMSLRWIEGTIVVESIVKEGPAERAGIRPNDVLVTVDRNDAASFNHHTLRRLLMSEPGRTVPIAVLREGTKLDLEVTLVSN